MNMCYYFILMSLGIKSATDNFHLNGKGLQMKSIISDEVLAALRNFEAGMDSPSIQPCVLANRDFDLFDVVDVWSGYLNDSWAPKIKEKLEAGFLAVRIQTEWAGDGHITQIYMVKLKS